MKLLELAADSGYLLSMAKSPKSTYKDLPRIPLRMSVPPSLVSHDRFTIDGHRDSTLSISAIYMTNRLDRASEAVLRVTDHDSFFALDQVMSTPAFPAVQTAS